MRWALIVIAVLGAALAYFVGLRFGYMTLTSTWMYNAQGTSRYAFRQYDEGAPLRIHGNCLTRSGTVTFRLYDPNRTEVASQHCPDGEYVLNLKGTGDTGFYQLEITYEHFTGRIYITEDVKAP